MPIADFLRFGIRKKGSGFISPWRYLVMLFAALSEESDNEMEYIVIPMKHSLTIVLMVLATINTIAQNKSTKVEYLDQDWVITKDMSKAVYYRTVEKVDGKYLMKDYYRSNDVLQMEAFCSSVNPKIVQDGKATFYHKNGGIERTGMYKENMPTGLHKRYYDSGVPKSEIIYEDTNTMICQYWGEDGKPLLVNGTGSIVEKESIFPQYIEVKDSVQISTYAIEHNQDTIYMFTETPATYRGGFEAFYRGVGNSLVYPKEARRKSIEGKVYVQFTVNKKGVMEDAKILKGIGGGCDEVALAACAKQTNWEAATYKGAPVKMRMVLPVIFRLR